MVAYCQNVVQWSTTNVWDYQFVYIYNFMDTYIVNSGHDHKFTNITRIKCLI